MDTPHAPADGSLPSATPPTPTPTTIDAADAILLNVLSPSNEVPGGKITFPRIHLDTKLSQLKMRIRNALLAGPTPDRQRLIYRGHALLNADATLRQVLRPQGSTEAHSDAYTLHLVLPPGNAATATIPTPAPPSVQATPVAPAQPAMPNGLPQMPGVQMPQQVLAQAQAAQMMLQNQLNMIQQQLAGHDHQNQQAHAHAHPHQIPEIPGLNTIPNGMHITYQIHQGQPIQLIGNMPTPPGFGFGYPNAAGFQAMMQQQQLMPHPAVAGHQPIPIPGQGAALQRGAPEGQHQESAATTTLSEVNESQGTGQSPMTTRIQETIGPQGQRIRTVIRESVNMTISRHGTPHTVSRPTSTEPTASQPTRADTPNSFMAAVQQGTNAQNQVPDPLLVPQPPHIHAQSLRHTPLPFMMPPPMPLAQAPPAQTMAWVLSSPSGPEALLFAPGHGYFSTAPQATSARLIPTRTSRNRAAVEIINPQDLAVGVGNAADLDLAPAAQALARLPHPNAVPAARLAEENEFLNFIVGRGWLFLRMYVFTFFISEPNTWTRYALLAIATLICMLPRDNFLRRGMVQVRRHIDALIGPPAAPARDGQGAPAPVPAPVQANAAGGTAVPGMTPPVVNPTPTENAARLLREHEARNPNIIRDVLFRIERTLAIFLASLVPGVGERHVRAREDQRREAERVENERRTREEAEHAQAQTQAETNLVGSADSGSTAVEPRNEAGEARERTTQAQVIETGA